MDQSTECVANPGLPSSKERLLITCTDCCFKERRTEPLTAYHKRSLAACSVPRHPMYVGIIAILLATPVMLDSWLVSIPHPVVHRDVRYSNGIRRSNSACRATRLPRILGTCNLPFDSRLVVVAELPGMQTQIGLSPCVALELWLSRGRFAHLSRLCYESLAETRMNSFGPEALQLGKQLRISKRNQLSR